MAAAALGGLALGLAALASLSVLPDLIPVIPFVGVLAAARRPQALPLGLGVLAGAGYAHRGHLGHGASRAGRPRLPRPAGQPDRTGVAVATVAAVAVAAWPPARSRAARLIPRPAALAAARGGRRAGPGGIDRLPDPAVGADRALEPGRGHRRVRRRAAEVPRPPGRAHALLRGGQPVLGHLVHRHPGAAARRVSGWPCSSAAACARCFGGPTRTAPPGPGGCRC